MLNSVLGDLPALIASYGYGLILVMLESLGLPLPGEATLITASIYAGATHDLTLTGIIAAAVAGAVISGRCQATPRFARYGDTDFYEGHPVKSCRARTARVYARSDRPRGGDPTEPSPA